MGDIVRKVPGLGTAQRPCELSVKTDKQSVHERNSTRHLSYSFSLKQISSLRRCHTISFHKGAKMENRQDAEG